MKILIIALIITALGLYLYFNWANRKYFKDNSGRRSGSDRRNSFIPVRKQKRKSDEDRRQTPDRREEFRYA